MSIAIPPEVLAERRQRIAGDWGLTREVVLVPSGLPIPIDGTDGHYPFCPHAEHLYLSGADVPGQVLTYDPDEGYTFFARVATEEEKVWEGDAEPLDSVAERLGIERVRPLTEFEPWLRLRETRPLAILGSEDILSRPRGYGLEGGCIHRIEVSLPLGMRLQQVVTNARRRKDEWELGLLRRAAKAAAAGHLAALRRARPGMTENELAALVEAEFLLAGSRRIAFETIVASRHRAGILHGLPTDRVLRDGELVLVDAGANVGWYNSDITRTFPVGERFSSEQKDIYEVVLAAQTAACDEVRVGREFREIHLATCVELARGLVDLGILEGDPEGLVERDVHALFFPHGLGHLLGLATHDVGGYAEGRKRSDRFGLNFLRADLPLEEGYVVTIEPGIYFIRALLADRRRRETFGSAVRWDRAESLFPVGGVRIEDDVLVTGGEPEILTRAVPKSVAALEALRAEACGG